MAFHSLVISALAMQSSAVWLAGVNLSGCELGMDTNGNFAPTDFESSYGCPSPDLAKSQIQHFSNKDGFNVYRLPVPWQSLVNNDLVTNELDAGYFAKYNELVKICLDTSANNYCIIDIHNYGRWWGGVIGQDGPNAGDLAKTWAQIAAHWASQPRVVFGTMNEPHDSGAKDANNVEIIDFNMDIWAATLQTVVNAIRNAGATSQMIFISPSGWANAGSFPGRSQAILTVQDPSDSSNKNLIFELHQYFDGEDGGGKNTYCTLNLVDKFESLASFLRQHKRQAFMGEIGGGSESDCTDRICGVLDVLNQNSDVFVGWTSWAAGNLWPEYELTELPTDGEDVGLVKYCFAPKFKASQ